jgi:hypothetical protein
LADKSKPVEAATAAPGEARSVSPPPPPDPEPPAAPPGPELAKGSESGDPVVQGLLADRSAAQESGNPELIAAVNARLAALGFE